MYKNQITLTSEELEEIKDTIKFREKIVLQLKMLNGVPKAVWKLEVQSLIHWFLIIGVLWIVVANGK